VRISIKATNLELTPYLESYVREKIGSVEKFLKPLEIGREIEVFVEIGKTTRHHQSGPFFRAEANLSINGEILRAEAEREDLYLAIVEVKDKLQRIIKKYKQKSGIVF